MKIIRYWLIQLLGVSKSEANGILILLVFLIILIFIPFFIKWNSSNNYTSFESDRILLDSILGAMISEENPPVNTQIIEPQLTNFDPNKVTIEEMLRLGFTDKQARNIFNYRNKNGVFKIKKDLMKIYSIDTIQYLKYESFILLPNELVKSATETSYTKSVSQEATIAKFDLNKIDTSVLQQINGIGSVLSNRIIKYRDRLGGFVTINQLEEVWGLKEEPLSKLKEHSIIEPNSVIKQININTANYDILYQHVYISKKVANLIIDYRNQHGNYNSIDDLKYIHLIDEQLFKKISPYITTE